MGTNYYLRGRPACDHCGRAAEQGLHIGKSSGGWTFGLRIYPPGSADRDNYESELTRLGVTHISSLDDWRPLLERHGVMNEYGDDVSFADMMKCITQRSHPNGLLRRHDLARAIGYRVEFPPGVTYDLVVGEFS